MSKVIVITGAGSGLGRALARCFVADGDHVVLLGRTMSKLEAVVGELGDNALAVGCDVGNPDSVRAAFAKIAERHPKIDVLINNAAKIDYSTLARASDSHIIDIVMTNLAGNMFASRAAINMMERGGHIINVTSVSVEEPYPHHVVYQGSKGGVEAMSKHLQDELRPDGIRVTVVRAGPMLDEDYQAQSGAEESAAFFQASLERGMNLMEMPVSHFKSITWVFRSLIDMPDDMHVDTLRFNSRKP
ncbi:MAG TPA: SDR family oxidoreductase [Sphingobium sp.]|uniref:SDR family oxidoreductase n=1 Tax=Sphingobium sp. TaxID=1912891 RepID=UPI002ED474AC